MLRRVCIAICILSTLIVTPWFNFDPINLPKLTVLAAGILPIATLCIRIYFSLPGVDKTCLILTGVFVASLIPSIFFSDIPIQTQIWGTWGRSTGFIAFLALSTLMVSSSILGEIGEADKLLLGFLRVSYFVTAYTTIQYAGLDPINWSQDLPVATLGNINFMSAFLGTASILAFQKLTSENSLLTSRIFFGLLIVLNMILIWNSGSIQGLIMFMIGASLILLSRANFFTSNLKTQVFFFVSLTPLILALLLGGLGRGPLGDLLKQETLMFRLDYWKAGVFATLNNFWFGVGLDGYGDFYRQYRDEIATIRTGPQRVSNTAHNIFLDISSGAGITAVLIYTFITGFALYSGFVSLKKNPNDNTLMLFALCSSFAFYSLISINQLGVTSWNWVFLGALIGSTRAVKINPQPRSKIKSPIKKGDLRLAQGQSSESKLLSARTDFKYLFALLALTFISSLLVLPNALNDHQYLSAYREKNLSSMISVAKSWSASDFPAEKTLETLVASGDARATRDLARWLIQKNPRSFYAHNVLRLLVNTSQSEKLNSISSLQDLDPQNMALQVELREQRASLIKPTTQP